MFIHWRSWKFKIEAVWVELGYMAGFGFELVRFGLFLLFVCSVLDPPPFHAMYNIVYMNTRTILNMNIDEDVVLS